MAKFGRNQPCPCGSKKKFKHCHGSTKAAAGSFPADAMTQIERAIRAQDATLRRRRQQQGLGRPILSAEISGHRVIFVGGRYYWSSKWRTFHDFLRDYLLGHLGQEWTATEQAKPAHERHPILKWYALAIEQAGQGHTADGRMFSAPMTGAIRAFMNLAYNIYLIAHHGNGQEMADIYLRRLQSARIDDFTGVLFETYAAATFLKAGFALEYEELARRSTSCAEFVATWPPTGERFSVEVKTRNPNGDASEPSTETKRLGVGRRLVKALSKKLDHTRVVMIEVNVPDELTISDQLHGWAAAAVSEVRGNERAAQRDGSLYPPAYVFVTNHAFHHHLSSTAGGIQVVADGFRIPDFGPEVRYTGYADVLAARERHAAMMALIDSIRTHYEIPATFDGELPSSLTTNGSPTRLRIGQHYLVPDETGTEVPGRLVSATVMQSEKAAYGIYELGDGRKIIATCPLSPEELEDYRSYPDTFFDAITPVASKASTFVEKCDFLFSTYQHSTRDKLLEFMQNAQDIEYLRTLSQRELAIIYCERMAIAMGALENERRANDRP